MSYLYLYLFLFYICIYIKHVCVSVQPNQFCSKQGKFALFSYKLKPVFVQFNTFHHGDLRGSESMGAPRLLGNMNLAALHSQSPTVGSSMVWGTVGLEQGTFLFWL